jgi:hypothetical protein
MSEDELLHLDDHVRYMRRQDLSRQKILKHYEVASESLIEAFLYPMMAKEQVIYLAPSKDNIICYQKPNTEFDPKNSKSYTIEVAYNEALPIIRNTDEEYTYETFETWDLPFIEAIEDSPKSTYSFELYLMSFIANSPRDSPKKPLWIHDMCADTNVKKQLDKDVPMFWFAMPRFQDYIYGIEDGMRMSYDKKYMKLERKMAVCARALAYKSRKQQYKILKRHTTLRKFLELIKTRSHIPTAFGVMCMAAVNASKFKRIQLYQFMRNPDKAPEPLKNMINYYWSSFLMPYKI